VAAWLSKPVRQSQLHDAIVTAIGGATMATAAEPAQDAPESALPPLGARVLVAEDNAVNQKVAVRLLEKLGCRVELVANGREAVEAAARDDYDCILMDCQMPEMDGYEATMAIRQREKQGATRTPIIAMTANAMPGDRDLCLAAGMDDYISKPVRRDALRAMVERWARAV
jgi:CheY-like chemotaxis protein